MNLLDAFWELRIAAESQGNAEYSDGQLNGSAILSPSVVEAMKTLDDAGDLSNVWIKGTLTSVANLPIDGTAKFEAKAPKGYFETINELIHRHPSNPPEPLRLFDPVEEDTLLDKYRQAASLAGILAELATQKSQGGCKIIGTTEIEIPFIYTAENLCVLNDIDEIRSKLLERSRETPEDARMFDIYRSLFRQAVYDVIAAVPKTQRFAHLLENFPDCLFRFNLAFRCFSVEANHAIERYEEKRAGMIGALNGVLGNIQTSLIGVPLAGLLALREMDPAQGLSFPNIIISVAAVVVGSLLLVLSFSQGRTLDAIGVQEKGLRDEIRDCGSGETKIGKLLQSMSNHHSLVYKLLVTVRVIILMFMLIAAGVLIWCA